MTRLAQRMQTIMPFHVVELFKQAQRLAAQGRDIISLGIGEPDFTAPPQVIAALERAANSGQSGYTAPAGTDALRTAIAGYTGEQFQAPIAAERVVVTAGASSALLLACLALIDPGDEILMADPSYPANCNFVSAAGGVTRTIPSLPEHGFQLTAADIREHWGPGTRGVLLASPGNPTGTSLSRAALQELVTEVRARDGFIIMDEIYLGLSYDAPPRSALAIDDDIVIINSFSKYFHMTGWRLGWMVVPPPLIPHIEKLAASLAICAPTLAQHAALACFQPDVMRIFEERRLAFKRRRDYLVPELQRLGLEVPAPPDGAFYVYADISRHAPDSDAFSQTLLHEAGIAAVPGLDFGPAHAERMMRFSYTVGLERLQEAVSRMDRLLA